MSVAIQAHTGLEIRKVHPHIGAEVFGVDLKVPLGDKVFEHIRNAFHEHSVLVFRDQDINDEQQAEFSASFGELERTSFAIASDNPYIYKMSNVDAAGNVLPPDNDKRTFLVVNQRWHTDSSFRANPATASALSAREVPETEPGDTEYASMRVGWETLPEARRAAIEGLSAVHSYAYTLSQFDNHGVKQSEMEGLPPVEHPLVRSDHPSGRRTCSSAGTSRGWSGWTRTPGARSSTSSSTGARVPSACIAISGAGMTSSCGTTAARSIGRRTSRFASAESCTGRPSRASAR